MLIVWAGVLQFFGAFGFVIGYFTGVEWLMVAGGLMVVADDIREMVGGYLQPALPILLACVGAVVFSPWYVGVFWASAVFKLFSQPADRRNIFSKPKKVLVADPAA